MSLQRQTMTSDELDQLVGARVVHIERVPSSGGEPGAFHWVLTLRPLPLSATTDDRPCTCATRKYGDPLCPRAVPAGLAGLPPGYAAPAPS